MRKKTLALGGLVLVAAPLLVGVTARKADARFPNMQSPTETRYLGFQIFTGAADPKMAIGGSGMHPLGSVPTREELGAFVRDIASRIGSVGSKQTRLAVVFGPVAFDHSDDEVRRLVASAFAIALQQKVAVGFHLDDSMFWARRGDLWRDPRNVEWMDWKGTPTTGRRIDWGPEPVKLPPQMCFNSKGIRAEVQRRGAVIGKAIKAGVDQLCKQGREDLFAGVIVGWETQIGRDFDTGRYLGYHALTNRGFSAGHPPKDLDVEREKIVQEFITLWCKGLADSGVSGKRIYSHTAFLSRRVFDGDPDHSVSYSAYNHFAPPSAAFGKFHRPGFSTYPQPGLFEQIYSEVARHGQSGWASSEGTNLQLGSGAGQSGMNMETYLAKMFNHGATLVNIFSWGVGGEANRKMDFRLATEGEEALRAYRKFLKGAKLTEAATTASTYLERLPAKIHRIQAELPAWVQKTGRQAEVESLMKELDAAMKAQNFVEAEAVADRILKLLDSK